MFSLYKIRERKIQSVLWIHFPLLSVSLWYRCWAFKTQPTIAINCTACYCSYCIVLLYINKIVGTILTIIAQWWTFYESQLLRLLRSNSTLAYCYIIILYLYSRQYPHCHKLHSRPPLILAVVTHPNRMKGDWGFKYNMVGYGYSFALRSMSRNQIQYNMII